MEDMPLHEMLRLEAEYASNGDLMPTVLVMLEGQQPVGMVALCLDDLDGRPDLNPWLAGVYVEPPFRGRGYALRLIEELEALARSSGIKQLSLYTEAAIGLYAKVGWAVTETFELEGKTYSIMRKGL